MRFDLTPGAAEEEEPATDKVVAADELWVVCDPCSSRVGVTTDVADEDGDVQYALKDFDGVLLPCRRLAVDKAATFVDDCRKNLDALCGAAPSRRVSGKGIGPEE